jgi:4-amino-4-deoxy-L-arabinose transferase-like glycosyltransferase
MTWLYPILFAMFVGFCFRVASRVSLKSLVDVVLTAFIVFAGSIILTGFVLSVFGKTSDRRFWSWGVFIPAFIFYLRFTGLFARERREQFAFFSIIGSRIQFFFEWYRGLSGYLKFVFGALFLTFFVVTFTNLRLVMYTVPNEWDSMTGHLVRVMYYIQRGTMAHFGGTNWNIDTYPKSVCTIQIYSYLMSGKHENFFKLIHHLSYWIGVFAAYGIAQRICRNFSASVFCALVFGLLPNVLLQATTTDTDIVLMAYLSCFVYFLMTYHATLKRRYLYLAGLAFGIAFGHKITFALLLPSLFFVLIYAFGVEIQDLRVSLLRFKHLVTGAVIGVLLFTLPAGYLRNIEVFGHPIGPPTATRHQSVERAGGITSPNLYEQGTRNVLRYGFDFLNLDGLRNVPAVETGPNRWLKAPFIAVEKALNVRLEEETDFTIQPFRYDRPYIFYNGLPYWSIWGFGLIFPLLLLVLTGVIRSKAHIFLGIAVLLHVAALSFSAPYDPFKGRYFISSSVFAVPFAALLFTRTFSLRSPRSFLLKSYAGLVVVVGCASALLAVFLNERSLPIPYRGRPSAFQAGRIAQMTWARPDISEAYQNFDRLVPPNATVALADINDDFEYPLFGKKLTRKLIPINPFERGVQPIPPGTDYLFFAASVIQPQPGDIRLGTDTTAATRARMLTPGEDYWLRKLK